MPIKPNKPGRPVAIAPSKDDRRRVELGIAAGVSQAALAALLNVSRRTFGRVFAKEIELGHAKTTVDMLLALFRAASRGNVAAAKAMLVFVQRSKPDPERVVDRWAGLADRIHGARSGVLPEPEIFEIGQLNGLHAITGIAPMLYRRPRCRS